MNPFERWSVWASSVLTTVTGLVYLWMKYFLVRPDPWAVVNHPLQPLVLKAHIIVSPLLVFAIGLILLRHIWCHYRMGVPRGRRSGVLSAVVVGPLVLTGYLIQSVTHLGWLRAVAIAHIVFGLVFGTALAGHQLMIRRRRTEPESAVRAPIGPRRQAASGNSQA